EARDHFKAGAHRQVVLVAALDHHAAESHALDDPAGSQALGPLGALPGVEGVSGDGADADALQGDAPLVAQVADVAIPFDLDVADAGPDRRAAMPEGALGLKPGLVDADGHRRPGRVRVAELTGGIAVVIELARLGLPRAELDDRLHRAAALGRDLRLELNAGHARDLPLVAAVLSQLRSEEHTSE